MGHYHGQASKHGQGRLGMLSAATPVVDLSSTKGLPGAENATFSSCSTSWRRRMLSPEGGAAGVVGAATLLLLGGSWSKMRLTKPECRLMKGHNSCSAWHRVRRLPLLSPGAAEQSAEEGWDQQAGVSCCHNPSHFCSVTTRDHAGLSAPALTTTQVPIP